MIIRKILHEGGEGNREKRGSVRNASDFRVVSSRAKYPRREIRANFFSPFLFFFFSKTKRTLQRSWCPFIDENFTATDDFPRERYSSSLLEFEIFLLVKTIAVYPISTAIENRATVVNSRLNLADFIPPKGGRRMYRGINIHGYLKNA